MKTLCRMLSRVNFLNNFSRKHYVCLLCGVKSSDAGKLCLPVEQEFEQ